MEKSDQGEYLTMNSRHFLLSCNPFWWSIDFLDTIGPSRSVCHSRKLTLHCWHYFFCYLSKITIKVSCASWSVDSLLGKVHIFWEGHKILRNLPLTFDRMYRSQKLGEDFAKFLWPSQTQHDGVRTTMKKRYTQNSFKIHF